MARKWRLFHPRIQSVLSNQCQQLARTIVLLLLFLGMSVLSIAAQVPSTNIPSELVRKGRESYDHQNYADAIKALEQAQQLYRGDALNQAMVLSNLSLAYQQLEQWQEARRSITQALDQLKQMALSRSTQQLTAQALLVKGQLELAVSQPETALQAWQTAETQFEQVQDTAGKHRSQLYQVLAMEELGFHRQALKTLLSIPDLFHSPEKAIAYRTLASLLRVTGVSEESEAIENLIEPKTSTVEGLEKRIPQYLRQSRRLLEISMKSANEQDQIKAQLELGNTALAAYKHVQDAYDRVQVPNDQAATDCQFKQAIKYYQGIVNPPQQRQSRAATLIWKKTIVTQAKLSQYRLSLDYAKWHHRLRSVSSTKCLVEKIPLDLTQLKQDIKTDLEEAHSSRSIVKARLNFAIVLLQEYESVPNQKEHSAILEDSTATIQQWLEDTHTIAQSLGDLRGASYSKGYLGKLFEQTNPKQARKYTQEALKIAEQIAEQGGNANDLIYQWEWQAGKIWKEQKQSKEAISAYQVAVQTLETLRGDLISFNNSDLQFSFRDNVEPIYRDYVDLLLSDPEASSNLGNVSAAQDALQKAQRAIEDLQVAELENFLKCQLVDIRRVPVYKAIDEKNLNAATIYTILLDDRLEVLLRLPGNNQFFRYTAENSPKELVEQTVSQLKKDINIGSPRENSDIFPSYRTVYNWVVGKMIKDGKLNGVKTLVFVLDGALRTVPMAALYDGQQFLIEKYSVAVNLGVEFNDRQPLQPGKFKIFAAGLDKELDGVRTELRQLEKDFKGRIEVLDGANFTAKNVEKKVTQQKFDVIHLATHGVFSSDPESTHIRVYDPKKEERLNLNQIKQVLRQRTNDRLSTIGLLFLSACQTAQGDKRASLGIAGMAMQTGANSVIASLMDAQENTAPTIIANFYDELEKPGVTKAEALQKAQLCLIQQSCSQSSEANKAQNALPKYWSSFILVGNWQ